MLISRAVRCRKFALISAVAGLFLPLPAARGTVNWNTGSGNWSGPNWTGGVGTNPPLSGDTAVFGLATTYTVTLDINPTIAQTNVTGSNNVTLITNGTAKTLASTTGVGVSAGSLTLGGSAATIQLNTGNFQVTNVLATANVLLGNDVSTGLLLLTAGTLNIDGVGSTFTDTGGATIANSGAAVLATANFKNSATGSFTTMSLGAFGSGGNGTISVQSDADVTASGNLSLGTGNVSGQSGTINVNAAGSTFIQSGATTITLGNASNSTGSITASAGGAFTSGTGAITVGAGSSIDVQASSTFTANGNVTVQNATSGTGGQGKITVGGTGALFTESGSTTLTIGSATGPAALVQANTGGTFTTGTGLTTVNALGTLDVNGGTFNANGNITITGGTLQRSSAGTFTWASGKTMTVQSGGKVNITGSYTLPNSAIVNVSGSSQFNVLTSGALNSASGSQLNVSSGGLVTVPALNLGVGDNGSATVDGVGSSLTSTLGTSIGSSGFAPTLTFSNSAAGALSNSLFINGNSIITVQSGADVISDTINIGGSGSSAINVTGSGSTWVQSIGSSLLFGALATNSGTVNIQSGGAFTTGTGNTALGSGGLLNVDGGTLNLNGGITVDGILQRTATAGTFFVWAAGKTMNVETGGQAIFAVAPTLNNSTVNVFGVGGTFSASSPLTIAAQSTMSVLNSGTASASSFQVGINSNGGLSVDGPASSITSTSSSSTVSIGTGGATGTLTVQNGGTANFATCFLNVAEDTVAGTTGTVTIQSGGTLSAKGLVLAALGGSGVNGNVTITGTGSTMSVPAGGFLTIGATSGATGTLNVLSGGALTVATSDSTAINATGVLNITGGLVSVGSLGLAGGTLNFNSGSLSFTGALTVGTGGLLGSNVTLDSSKTLATTGITTINAFQTLALTGGTLSTSNIINNGTFNFSSGTLNLTGGSGLTVGTGGALGDTLNVAANQKLNVTGLTTVASSGTLVVGDGRLTVTGGLTNNGEIRLSGTAPRLVGGTLTNNLLIRGDGRIDNNTTNNFGGEIRGESGKTLLFTGTNGTNGGNINLQGGTVEFSQALTNSGSGLITGRGYFYVDAVAGLTNSGQLQLSSGTTDVHANVTSTNGSKIIVSGGSTSTFYNPVIMQSGSEFRVSTGSTAVFFGMVNGTNFFTGTGTKDFEGGSSALGAVLTGGSTYVAASASVNATAFGENSLSVDGNVTIPQNGTNTGTSKVGTLAVAGKLDLTNNKMIVTSGSVGSWTGSSYSGITGLIASGRNGGAWNGSGIVTSQSAAAGSNGLTTLAVAAAGSVGKTSFGGQAVSPTDVLVMYTYDGDANLNGKIDADDYFQIDSNYNKPASTLGYFKGDFDYNGRINGDDYFIIDSNYVAQGGAFSASEPVMMDGVQMVPEPGVMGGVLALVGVGSRRRRST